MAKAKRRGTADLDNVVNATAAGEPQCSLLPVGRRLVVYVLNRRGGGARPVAASRPAIAYSRVATGGWRSSRNLFAGCIAANSPAEARKLKMPVQDLIMEARPVLYRA